jgi:hypothetical protein
MTEFNKSKETAVNTINKASSQRTLQPVEELNKMITTEHATPKQKFMIPAHQKSTSTRVEPTTQIFKQNAGNTKIKSFINKQHTK